MSFIPCFFSKNNYLNIIIFEKIKFDYKLVYKEKFYIEDENFKEIISNIENILDILENKLSLVEDKINNNENINQNNSDFVKEFCLLFNNKNIKLIFNLNKFDESKIIFNNDLNKSEIFKVNFNNLYSNLEKFYLFLHFKDYQYIFNQIPKNYRSIIDEI